jgi:hypothetical protein
MKNLFIFILFFIFQFSFLNNNCFAQFQSDVRLTNDPATSIKCFNNADGIATEGDFVHVFWSDYRIPAANDDIFYKRSTDKGLTWSPDIRLTFDPSASKFPSVAEDGQILHVVWQDHRIGGGKVFYKRSPDAGLSWGQDVQLTFDVDPYFSYHPDIAASGSILHLVWFDNRDGNQEIYYKRSTDGGLTWEPDVRLTYDPSSSDNASVAVLGSLVHVVWSDSRDGNKEIYYKRSPDDGLSWGQDIRLTNDSAESSNPSISVSGAVMYVVWQDVRSGWEIYGKRSTDGGLTWGMDTRLTNNPYNSFYPSVSVSGENVHVVWQDVRDNNWEIYYKRSTDAGLTWGDDTRLTVSDYDSFYPSIAIAGTAVHVLWEDNRDGNYEMYYKQDPTGNPTGIVNIGTETPLSYSLSQNYPNPFNPSTTIKFSLPKTSNIELIIYDELGRVVSTLVNQQLNPGNFEVNWDASNYTSGIYFYRLATGDYTKTMKMVLIK